MRTQDSPLRPNRAPPGPSKLTIPVSVLRRRDLTTTAKLVYGLVRRYGRRRRVGPKAIRRFAQLLRVNPRTIRRALGQLCRAGFLDKYARLGHANEYELRPPPETRRG